jgi:cyclopropane fatty-acyl-phospholipid synthase-like methyltransferase
MNTTPSKSLEELRALHGENYVKKFQRVQSVARIANVLKRIPLASDMHVADFACGDGMLLEAIAPQVRHYTGVDFSAPFIAAAAQRQARLGVQNATFVCGSIQDFAADHVAAFDAGFALDFSEHVYDRDWLPILQAMRASLKPGGRLFLHTPNGAFIPEAMKRHGFILKQFPEHIAVRTLARNAETVEQAGFSIVRKELIPHYNALRLVHPLSKLPLVGGWFGARVFIEAAA